MDSGNNFLREVFARLPNRQTVELDPDTGKVARPPSGDDRDDIGAGARGKQPRPTPEMNDLLRAQVFGVSADDVRRSREQRTRR